MTLGNRMDRHRDDSTSRLGWHWVSAHLRAMTLLVAVIALGLIVAVPAIWLAQQAPVSSDVAQVSELPPPSPAAIQAPSTPPVMPEETSAGVPVAVPDAMSAAAPMPMSPAEESGSAVAVHPGAAEHPVAVESASRPVALPGPSESGTPPVAATFPERRLDEITSSSDPDFRRLPAREQLRIYTAESDARVARLRPAERASLPTWRGKPPVDPAKVIPADSGSGSTGQE